MSVWKSHGPAVGKFAGNVGDKVHGIEWLGCLNAVRLGTSKYFKGFETIFRRAASNQSRRGLIWCRCLLPWIPSG